MAKNYTIEVTDEVEKALQKVATKRGISAQQLVEDQLIYYIGCALYSSFPQTAPVNTPGLSITQRLDVYAIGVNVGEIAARAKVDELLNLVI